MGRTGRAIASLLVATLTFVVTAEVAVRVARPTPRAQVVRAEVVPWTMVEGVPTWDLLPEGRDLLERPPCVHDPEATQVVLAGDSVFQFARPPELPPTATPEERFAAHLTRVMQAALDRGGGRWCVRNVSQSGYLPYQQAAALRAALAEAPIHVAVVEVFKYDERYVQIGGDLYGVESWPHTAAGTPRGPLPLPDAAQDALFAWSAAWAYATLATGEPGASVREDDEAYREILGWARERGIEALFVEVPHLDRPFAESAADPGAAWERLRGEVGERYRVLAAEFVHRRVEELRLDLCCHYGPEGHRAVGEALAGMVRHAVTGSTPRAEAGPTDGEGASGTVGRDTKDTSGTARTSAMEQAHGAASAPSIRRSFSAQPASR